MPAPAGVDPEAAYYQTIEEFFVSRRGDPLFLSNADWLLIRKWRGAGIPLRIVLRGIADALEDHARSWGRSRKVGSLAYCAAEVEASRERWQRAVGLGQDSDMSPPRILRWFATSLEAARDLGPDSARLAAALVSELRGRADGATGTSETEDWLSRREAELLEALRREDGVEAVARVEAVVDADLAPYRERMPARVLDQIRDDSVARRILEGHGLPRLSLFHAA